MMRKKTLASSTILGSVVFSLATSMGFAAANAEDINNLLNLSLEQLSNIEVTSVSKKSEKASEAAAAIFVITQDDIKRSGMTSIPELLRMVPGISVAQSGAHAWAITSRGTSSEFANKLLVLIDGRSVYTPLFSGVYWDIQDVMLEDIERIEVIRGPGATLWGANAVNGVINIITKSAKDTQGGIASLTAGNQDRSLNSVRYGAKIDDNTYARVYAKYDDRDEFRSINRGGVDDAWNKGQSGFRVDANNGGNLSYTVQGDVYRSSENYVFNLPQLVGAPFFNTANNREISQGANVLGRLNYKQSNESSWTLQTYFDDAQRNNLVLYDTTNTLDVDLQHVWTPHERHEFVWGLGYRLVSEQSRGTFYNFLIPPSRSDNLFSAFIQDKIALVPNQFYLTLGSKFENNDYTGFEKQPSARLTWLIDNKQTLWSSVSHAVRTPNRFGSDGTLVLGVFPPGGPAVFAASLPNPAEESEELNAYEVGYRIQPVKTVSLDTTAFYNHYSKLVTGVVGGAPVVINIPGSGPTAVLPITPVNGNSGTTTGVEVAANWEVTPIWQLNASYSRLNFTLKNAEQTGFSVKGFSPKDQANLRSTLKLPHNVELDNSFYYVDQLTGPNIPAYLRADARLGWKPMDNLEFSLVGQNLLNNVHQEFTGFVFQNNAKVPRTYYGNVTVKF